MHYLETNFQKSPSAEGRSPLIFDFSDLNLRDLAKLWFFKLAMTKSNFKK